MRLHFRVEVMAACVFAGSGLLLAQGGSGVTYPSGFAISAPLSSIDDPGTQPGYFQTQSPLMNPGRGTAMNPAPQDRAAQRSPGRPFRGSKAAQFPGTGANGYAPSDDNLAVGPHHIVQVVNVRYQIFDKGGNSMVGPNSLGSLWAPLGAPCNGSGGDATALYDKLADRWFITQLGLNSSNYMECIAVSQTNDPTGSYYLYAYSFGSDLNDYPKFGIWPTAHNSALLATYNLFLNAQIGLGADLCGYDRTAMLAGAPSPAQVCHALNGDFSYLPSDMDGTTPPADGTPGYFMTLETTTTLRTYQATFNFATASGTFTQVPTDLTVTAFAEACNGGTCVPQKGTTNQLDSLGDRPMYRLPYRVFSDHATLLMNHSVSVGGVSAPRWYELRQTPVSTSGAFTVYQQGTFNPDSTHRWMGSIAMDQAGNIGMGYSASSGTLYPSIRYTGRAPTDPLGTMEAEASILEGTGSQTGSLTRWGDYSAIQVDPSDDCTFWYTNQYEPVDGSFNWSTAIGSFKMAGCGGPPTPDFGISANPSLQTVIQGATASSTITLSSLNSYAGTVNLSFSPACPSNTICSLPASVTVSSGSSATAQFSVATSSTTPVGTYPFTITGTDGPNTHPTSFTVTVNPPTPDFGISLSQSSMSIPTGSSGTLTVSLTAVGGVSTVSLSQTGAPPKSTVTFSPTNVTTSASGAISTIKISTNKQAPKGTFTVMITGKNGTFTHSVPLTLNLF